MAEEGSNGFDEQGVTAQQWRRTALAGKASYVDAGSVVAGVDAASPGFGGALIQPRPGGSLTHAGVSYDSVRGRIGSRWELSGSAFRPRTRISANTTATVRMPTTDANGVEENGVPAGEAEGVGSLREEDGAAVFAVGSGG